MKRTTYILIGMFFFNIVLGFAGIFYLKTNSVNTEELGSTLDCSGEPTILDLQGVHTLEFSTTGWSGDNYYCAEKGEIDIVSSSAVGDEKIIYPHSNYIKLDKQDGVLRVLIDISTAVDYIEEHASIERIALENLQIRVEAGRAIRQIHSTADFYVRLEKVELDSLSLSVSEIAIDSCRLGSLVIAGSKFSAKNSNMNDLYIDLDETNRWEMTNNNIGTLHLTGTGNKRITSLQSQFDKLKWTPKNDRSQLRFVLEQGAELVMVDSEN